MSHHGWVTKAINALGHLSPARPAWSTASTDLRAHHARTVLRACSAQFATGVRAQKARWGPLRACCAHDLKLLFFEQNSASAMSYLNFLPEAINLPEFDSQVLLTPYPSFNSNNNNNPTSISKKFITSMHHLQSNPSLCFIIHAQLIYHGKALQTRIKNP